MTVSHNLVHLACIHVDFYMFNGAEFFNPPVITLCTLSFLPGVRKLYHGVGYSIPRAIIGSGSHFVFYETSRKILLRKERRERQELP